jgi:hypothetical protein
MENGIGVAYALRGLAALIELPAQRAQLLGAAATGLDAARLPMDHIECAHYEATIAAVRAQLVEATFAAAWAEGHDMSLEQLVAAIRSTPLRTSTGDTRNGFEIELARLHRLRLRSRLSLLYGRVRHERHRRKAGFCLL